MLDQKSSELSEYIDLFALGNSIKVTTDLLGSFMKTYQRYGMDPALGVSLPLLHVVDSYQILVSKLLPTPLLAPFSNRFGKSLKAIQITGNSLLKSLKNGNRSDLILSIASLEAFRIDLLELLEIVQKNMESYGLALTFNS